MRGQAVRFTDIKVSEVTATSTLLPEDRISRFFRKFGTYLSL